MRKSRFTDSQIFAVLKQAENGMPIPAPPINVSCPACGWVAVIVPKSDAIVLGDLPQCCKRSATWLAHLARQLSQE